MSDLLPLYPGGKPAWTPIEQVVPVVRDEGCQECTLHKKARSVCVVAAGSPGGLLVVGEAPGRHEDGCGRPFVGKSGRLLHKLVREHWGGPYAVDNAVRCFPGRGGVTDKAVNACRRYLAHTIRTDVQPTRIITVGATAARSVLGRAPSPFGNRRSYGWLRGLHEDGEPIPVMMVLHPAAALRNRFVMQWFEADMKWACTWQPPRPPWDGVVQVVDASNVEQAVSELRAAEWFAFDVETMGRMWTRSFQLLCLGTCAKGSDSAWVWDRDALLDDAARQPLEELLADETVAKVGANVKYDQLAVHEALGVVVRNVTGDVRLQRKLLEPEASGYLKDMVELVGMGGIKEEAMNEQKNIVATVKRALGKLRKDNDPSALEALRDLGLPRDIEAALRLGANVEAYEYGLLPRDTLLRYNARDAVGTAHLGAELETQLAGEPQLARIWERIVRPASMALERVEHWGIACDYTTIQNFDRYLEVKKAAAEKQLDQYPDVNWKSPKQVAELLYDKLKLPIHHHTDSGAPSTDDESLQFLESKHPLPAALREFRTVVKLQDQYAQGMVEHIRDDGRIHPNIKLDGARSGRTSCTDPNLQNIPRAQTVEGKMARDCFIAPAGKVLIELDYSQLELRIAAALSGDPDMKAIFDEGVDYHRRTAELISQVAWGISPSQVTDQHRSWAKGVNFGILYGKTANSLAAEWGVSRAKAQAVMDAIMGQFKQLTKWCDEQLRFARRNGCIWTWWDGERGRRRPLWPIGDSGEENSGRRITAENGAVNTPIQGTASEFCIASLAECVDWIEEDGLEDDVKLVLTVHDSIMFEASEHLVDEVIHTGKAIMGSWYSAGVPLVVDHKTGKAWGSLKEAA